MIGEVGAPPIVAILAGPNGAGKSTLYHRRVAPLLSVPFVNADDIQRTELKEDSPKAAYRAAEIAAERRDTFLNDGVSFATETVFSHESKLDLIDRAYAAGHFVIIFHVGVESPDLSVERVKGRVAEGGHMVPEDKIRARYERNGPLIREAVLRGHRAEVYDNSTLNSAPRHVLSFSEGKLVHADPNLPTWTSSLYADQLSSTR